VKKLARLILRASVVPLLALALLGASGQFIGRASGLKVQNYIPPNLTPSVETACAVVQENQSPDLFQLPS
jgi:hypothetical protein